MEMAETQNLVRKISRSIIAEVAPEEKEIFDELIDEYFHDLTPPDFSPKSKDDPLGFGLDEIVIAVTPAVAAMLSALLGTLKEKFPDLIKSKIEALFPAEEDDDKPAKNAQEKAPHLDKEQLKQVRRLAHKEAVRFGMSEDKAEKLADALIGKLALAK